MNIKLHFLKCIDNQEYLNFILQFVEITREQSNVSRNYEQDVMQSRSEPVQKTSYQKRHQKSNIDSFIIGGNYSHYLNNKATNKNACGIQIYLDQFYYRKLIDQQNISISSKQMARFDLFNWPDCLTNIKSLTLNVLIVVEELWIKQAQELAVQFWKSRISAMIVNNKNYKNLALSYKSDLEIKSSQNKRTNEVRWSIRKFKDKEEDVLFQDIFNKIISYLLEFGRGEGTENKLIKKAQSKQK